MKLIIDVPEKVYQNAKEDMLFGSEIIVNAIKNGDPQETVTEFADRCKECGAKCGRLLRQKTDTLDKIRSEINEYGSLWVEYKIEGHSDRDIEKIVEYVLKQAKQQVLEIIDKYRQEG